MFHFIAYLWCFAHVIRGIAVGPVKTIRACEGEQLYGASSLLSEVRAFR
jgi:hypothetical protein